MENLSGIAAVKMSFVILSVSPKRGGTRMKPFLGGLAIKVSALLNIA